MSGDGYPRLAVALGEYDTGWHDPVGSLRDADAVAARAAAGGARLVVLPEMATTGFTMDTAQAVPLDSPVVDRLRGIAEHHEVWLAAGIALREPRHDGRDGGEERAVNALVVIDPAGRVGALHRKRRLFAYGGEHAHYEAGDDSTCLTIDGVRTALFVCYELRFPDLFAAVADAVDLMVVVANWPAARRAHWDILLRARAIESQCAIVGVNRTGEGGGLAYDGGSAAFGPWGDPLVPNDAGVVIVDAGAVAEVRARYPFLKDR
ncbi:MAG TPA: nitrilase-related carbon-nitrogen hydrolase [Gemmatimonadaceae bacterium]|nr:nitrilase-related carbon-nitrogen hydrolase [Gemmatimonadaceae bacterium]